jgi:hypothetical protein
VEPATKKIPDSSRHLPEQILRAFNQIRKPSTAGEITELLNRDLDREDSPFQVKDVAEWLQKTDDMALTPYWSTTRPRKKPLEARHPSMPCVLSERALVASQPCPGGIIFFPSSVWRSPAVRAVDFGSDQLASCR